MGKQKKLLKTMIEIFEKINFRDLMSKHKNEIYIDAIRLTFQKSINKSDLIRKILNEVVLSNDEIVNLLRIIFDKEK